MRRPKPTADERARIKYIDKKLESLWDQHRREAQAPQADFPEDLMRGDIFCDFMDWQRRNHRVTDFEELEGLTVRPNGWVSVRQPSKETVEPDVDDILVQILREVRTELMQEELELKRERLRKFLHEAPLRELHARRGVLDMSV